MKRLLAVLAATAVLGGLAACETATPYQPLDPRNQEAGGYSDVRLDAADWRVSFNGNSLTSRETVERYLLYRAAELTASQGFDWFVTDDKQTDKQTSSYVDPIYGYGFQPSWRFYGAGGWGGWGYWGDPAWAGPAWGPWGSPGPYDVQQFNRYEVSARLRMGHGQKPARALAAREVMMNLGPQIQRPKA